MGKLCFIFAVLWWASAAHAWNSLPYAGIVFNLAVPGGHNLEIKNLKTCEFVDGQQGVVDFFEIANYSGGAVQMALINFGTGEKPCRLVFGRTTTPADQPFVLLGAQDFSSMGRHVVDYSRWMAELDPVRLLQNMGQEFAKGQVGSKTGVTASTEGKNIHGELVVP